MACPPIITHVDRASFNFWSKEDIKKISVKHVTEPKSFEKKTGSVHEDGLYSKALGPCKRGDICTTCDLTDYSCPGHYGHIELSVPVYHPMLVQTMYQIISKTCLECFRFRLAPAELTLFLAQLEALNNGYDHLIEQLSETASEVCRGEKGNPDYISIYLREQLDKLIAAEKLKTPGDECSKRPQQRSIVERLSKIFRGFIQGQLIKPAKVCPHCGQKKQTTSLHHQISIVLGVTGTKSAIIDNQNTIRTSAKTKKSLTWNDMHYLRQDEKLIMSPIGARHVLRQLWLNERQTMRRIFHFLNLDYDKSKDEDDLSKSEIIDLEQKCPLEERFRPTDLFFIDTILVPPCKYRPPMSQRGYSFEGPRTAALANVMKNSVIVKDKLIELIKDTDKTMCTKLQTKLLSHWRDLQLSVHCLYDNEMDRYGKDKYPGLKQLIDKKEGLFRKNMMGKRVNFAARSVISPDPNISVDQIGVPLVFAKVLTYPQPVTPWNINQLREAITNGPQKYPGATSVQFDDGVTISLAKESARLSIAARLNSQPPRMHPKNPKAKQDTPQVTIVNRHLLTGDVLLFNRQPTLHKPSIMAFRARVLPNEKGFRLHYANCKSFNADFDGDEMNAHLPQSELARSEAYNIVNVNHQYLVPKDGSPLGGLIQDHVVAPCILTHRDQFYDKERYHQLVFCALQFLDREIKLEGPVIIKPEPLWTGKQIITTIIKNCIPKNKPAPTLKIKAKVGPKVMNVTPEFEDLSDAHVIINDGELLTGLMDKSNVGATQYGLIHTCYELYGGETSSNLMSAFARLSTWFLQLYEGFTLGIADILCDEDADLDRKKKIQESLTVGTGSAKEALGFDDANDDDAGEHQVDVSDEVLEDKLREAHSDRDPLPMKKLDAAMKKRTDKISSDISSRCLPGGLIRRFPVNNLQMMIQSGAKGGTVNALQISCLLGQIELEGRRVPLSMSGRSLPSFKPYDTSPKAGGFVSGRFLTGIQPQEFFFHCMAGREGLIDTAVKTSRSGYLQRCLIKHLEGLTVNYDQTVRDSCGSVIQFLYGEDGLDIVRSQMLKEKAFSILVDNAKTIGAGEKEQQRLDKLKELHEENIITQTNEIQNWVERNGNNRVSRPRGSGFLNFQTSRMQTDTEEDIKPIEAWYALSFKEKRKWNKDWDLCPDPLTALMNPGSHFGVVPEKLDEKIESFIKNSPLIVDPSTLIAQPCSGCDDNPELTKTLATLYDQMPGKFNRPKMTKHEFYNLCYNLYMKMLAQPGESVGLLAAQSIGEPSTQMTLNTFHFAGRGEMNVTLGIPRLREILMTASANIGTPSMDLPVLAKMYDDETGEELSVEETEERAHKVRLALNAVRLSDVLEYVDIIEEIIDEVEAGFQMPVSQGTRSRKRLKTDEGDTSAKKATNSIGRDTKAMRYTFVFSFLPRKYYKHEFKTNTKEIMQFMEETFTAQLDEAIHKRQKRLALAESIFDQAARKMNKARTVDPDSGAGGGGTGSGNSNGNGSGAAAAGGSEESPEIEEKELDKFNESQKAKDGARAEEAASSSEEDDDEDNDNTMARLKNRQNPEMDYEEAEDEDLIVADADAKDAEVEENDDVEVLGDEDVQLILPMTGSSGTNNDPMPATGDDNLNGKMEDKKIIIKKEKSEKKHKFTIVLTIQMMNTRLDMGALIEAEAKKTYINRVGQIQRALIVKDVNAKQRGSKCELMIKTEGVSLLSLVRFSHILDLNSIYSNDIHAIARTYGIEAAAQVIRREMANVFAVYGIEVDSRHLSLIADYMTFNGSIRGMNRMSMEASASPFQQMSFESSIRYLKGAAILGLHDDIKSPSAALVFGRPTRSGTGLFATMTDPESNKHSIRLPRSMMRGASGGGGGRQQQHQWHQQQQQIRNNQTQIMTDSRGEEVNWGRIEGDEEEEKEKKQGDEEEEKGVWSEPKLHEDVEWW